MYYRKPSHIRIEVDAEEGIYITPWRQLGGIAFQLFGHRKEAVILMGRMRLHSDGIFYELVVDVVRNGKRARGPFSFDPDPRGDYYMLRVNQGEKAYLDIDINWAAKQYIIQLESQSIESPGYAKIEAEFQHERTVARRLCTLLGRNVKTKII